MTSDVPLEKSLSKDSGLLVVNNLKKYFRAKESSIPPIFARKTKSILRAVDDVSFHVKMKETLGIVGESGSGKSTVAKLILGLLQPTSGEIYFDGKCSSEAKSSERLEMRKKMGAVFQDPYSSLNPVKTIGQIVGLPLRVRGGTSAEEIRARVKELLEQVGMDSRVADRFPHMLSGGQRQRIAIARALAANPDLIVLDEPVSSLDVSIQAQILNLLQDLKEKFGLTYVLIAHNIAAIHHMCDRILVLYKGKVMEVAPSKEIVFMPRHPYTKALISAIPIPDPNAKWEGAAPEIESVETTDIANGCVFKTRCSAMVPHFGLGENVICNTTEPALKLIETDHLVACHLYNRTVCPEKYPVPKSDKGKEG